MKPLISCIMPVRNRQEFIAGALACYRAQTYHPKELIVVDNSDTPIKELILDHADCYDYVGPDPKTVGWMRNRCCENAAGELIAHWDSDDWSHPNRLSEQYKLLIAQQAGLVGYQSMPFIDEERKEAWLYVGERRFALGTSFLYTRHFWRSHKFGDHLTVAEDGDLLQRVGGAVSVPAKDRMIARIHGGNTSPKRGLVAQGQFWRAVDYEQVARMIR
jgi:glycosyltransferase involved in cell wall biosynthesis